MFIPEFTFQTRNYQTPISPKTMAEFAFSLLDSNYQCVETSNSYSVNVLYGRIKRGEINSLNFFNLLTENLSLISEASGIETKKGEILNYSKLLAFLKEFEKLVKNSQI